MGVIQFVSNKRNIISIDVHNGLELAVIHDVKLELQLLFVSKILVNGDDRKCLCVYF